MQESELYKRIRAEIETISLIDTHEHLVSEGTRLSQKIDFFYWFQHYASSDLVSAGMAAQTLEGLRDPERPLDERWAEFAPTWAHVRTTAYDFAQALDVVREYCPGVRFSEVRAATCGTRSKPTCWAYPTCVCSARASIPWAARSLPATLWAYTPTLPIQRSS